MPAGDGGTGVDSVSVSDVDSVCELMREVVERIEIFGEVSLVGVGDDDVLEFIRDNLEAMRRKAVGVPERSDRDFLLTLVNF